MRLDRLCLVINRCDPWFRALGLGWLTQVWQVLAGDNPMGQLKEIWRLGVVPALANAGFLLLWATLAAMVQTSLGAIPGPGRVWQQVGVLIDDATAKRVKAQEFHLGQDAKNAALVAKGKPDAVKTRRFAGKSTFPGQILTSIRTVFPGFLIGTIIAVPLGILCGLSPTANAAINPLVQIVKPVVSATAGGAGGGTRCRPTRPHALCLPDRGAQHDFAGD